MTKEFYISDKALAAMNAVEGLSLDKESQTFLDNLRAQNLTPEQQRNVIREAYAEKV